MSRARPRQAAGASAPNDEIDLGPLGDLIPFNLRLAQDTALQVFVQNSRERNFRPGHFAALMIIRLNPGLTQIQLGRGISRDKSSVTPLVKGLERDGLIERRPSTSDRRSVTLQLTPKGEAHLDELLVHVRAHDRKVDELVGLENKPEFLRLLKKIIYELS